MNRRPPLIDDTKDLLDDLFHGCAFAAFVEEAQLAQQMPCPEKTKRRAYRYFEAELAKKQDRSKV